MSAALTVNCPNCRKAMKVPAQYIGKLIRCKECAATFEVPDPAAPPPPAKPAKPVPARPAKAVPPPADAPIPFKADDPPAAAIPPDDDDDNPNPYGVQKDDLDVPRCPFCALELDPPDAKVCVNCGYDLIARRRHDQKKVYETSGGDIFLFLLPAILCVLAILLMIAVDAVLWVKMDDWLVDSFLDTGEKSPVTDKRVFYIKPWCCPLWVGIIFAFLSYSAGKFAIKRFIKGKPDEVIKR